MIREFNKNRHLNNSGWNFEELEYLKPINGNGVVFLFNTVKQGYLKVVMDQIRDIAIDWEISHQAFTSFGPFDNLVKFEVNDYTVINSLASLSGVNSQQIQCAYPIWKSTRANPSAISKPVFACITQLKIQNYLVLNQGHLVEDCVAELLQDQLSVDDISFELFGTLGWEEFLIYSTSNTGFHHLFNSVGEKLRKLTLGDIKSLLQKRGYNIDAGEIDINKRHLFLSTYSTPAYDIDFCHDVESAINQCPSSNISDCSSLDKQMEKILVKYDIDSKKCAEQIIASTRFSVKPGHENKARKILLDSLDFDKEELNNMVGQFLIGRYDIYSWVNKPFGTIEFIKYFELTRYLLSGNLLRTKSKKEFLKKSQYYNSFTVLSHVSSANEITQFDNRETSDAVNSKLSDENNLHEGYFVTQLEKLMLSNLNNISIKQRIEEKELDKYLSESLIVGLERIFSLFDACITDRFTSECFLDMFPFMKRLRDILDTIEKVDGVYKFSSADRDGLILLPESKTKSRIHPMVTVVENAIIRFYRGFIHRYLPSYPMMDKNETIVDFSGRLQRILAAVTGMQNLLLEDLNCHLKKGFNVVRPYPNIRMFRDSFNISEATIFHVFQIETFYIMYHEVFHVLCHDEELKKTIQKFAGNFAQYIPSEISPRHKTHFELLFQEIIGDAFLLSQCFQKDVDSFCFFFWLMITKFKKQIDTHILLRFLVMVSLKDSDKEKDAFEPKNNEEFSAKLKQLLEDVLIDDELLTHSENSIDSFLKNEKLSYSDFNLVTKIVNHFVKGYRQIVEYYFQKIGYPEGNFQSEIDSANPISPVSNQNKRQWASLSVFRQITKFIYQNREFLNYKPDSVITFKPGLKNTKALKETLFSLRIKLTNTLYWESLSWKTSIMKDNDISFPISFDKND